MEKKQDKMRPKKSVNLQTIADAVGVSVVSVSNALSGKPGVSRQLRETICQKAEELGYEYRGETGRQKQPVEKRNAAIMVLPHTAPSCRKRLNHLTELLEKEAQRCGIAISKERVLAETEGIFLVGAWTGDEISRIRNSYMLPVVTVGGWSTYVRADYVTPDVYHSMYDAAAKLIKEGAKKPGFLILPEATDTDRDRKYGFWSALSELCGMPVYGMDNVFYTIPEAEASGCDVLFCAGCPADSAPPKADRLIVCGEGPECGERIAPDDEEMVKEAVGVLSRRMKYHDESEGVQYVQELSQIK